MKVNEYRPLAARRRSCAGVPEEPSTRALPETATCEHGVWPHPRIVLRCELHRWCDAEFHPARRVRTAEDAPRRASRSTASSYNINERKVEDLAGSWGLDDLQAGVVAHAFASAGDVPDDPSGFGGGRCAVSSSR